MVESRENPLEVHVAGICIDGDKVLIAKRAMHKKHYPGKWETGGGKVELGESFEDALIREMQEEFGILVVPKKIVGTYIVEEEYGVIPGIYFACEIKDFLSCEGIMITEEHSEWKWIDVGEVDDYDFIESIPAEIIECHRLINE